MHSNPSTSPNITPWPRPRLHTAPLPPWDFAGVAFKRYGTPQKLAYLSAPLPCSPFFQKQAPSKSYQYSPLAALKSRNLSLRTPATKAPKRGWKCTYKNDGPALISLQSNDPNKPGEWAFGYIWASCHGINTRPTKFAPWQSGVMALVPVIPQRFAKCRRKSRANMYNVCSQLYAPFSKKLNPSCFMMILGNGWKWYQFQLIDVSKNRRRWLLVGCYISQREFPNDPPAIQNSCIFFVLFTR